jgi:predicted transposase YdaD
VGSSTRGRRRGDTEGRAEGKEKETSSGWDELWEVVEKVEEARRP